MPEGRDEHAGRPAGGGVAAFDAGTTAKEGAPVRMGAEVLGQQESGPGGDLGAHPKLGALIGALLELRFLPGPHI
jgi:hypothetical protein